MTVLVWDEGVSVGIEAIDDEHKQIFTVIAKLTSVKPGEISTSEIETVFTELSHYVSVHFANEEALLEQITYPELAEHKKKHRDFIDKLQLLKQQWLKEDSLVTSEKITMLLHQWIVNHILIEDLGYAQALLANKDKLTSANKKQLDKLDNSSVNSNSSKLEKISSSFVKKVKLSQRVFITTLMPIIAVFILCVAILYENYQRFKSIDLVIGLTNVIEQVNDITHSLQAERGLSSGLTSSNYQFFSK